MKLEIEKLQENEVVLRNTLNTLKGDKESLQANVEMVKNENSALKARIDELNQGIETLQNAEEALKAAVAELNDKVQAGADQDTKDQIHKLEQLHANTLQELEGLVVKLDDLEIGLKQCSTFGIFSYIAKEHQATFINAVEAAVSQDMTYAQINEYLTSNLSPELDKVIKDHPSLTKTYIRNLRKE